MIKACANVIDLDNCRTVMSRTKRVCRGEPTRSGFALGFPQIPTIITTDECDGRISFYHEFTQFTQALGPSRNAYMTGNA